MLNEYKVTVENCVWQDEVWLIIWSSDAAKEYGMPDVNKTISKKEILKEICEFVELSEDMIQLIETITSITKISVVVNESAIHNCISYIATFTTSKKNDNSDGLTTVITREISRQLVTILRDARELKT